MSGRRRYEVTAIGAIVYAVWADDPQDAIERFWDEDGIELIHVSPSDCWDIERVETGH